MTVYSQVKQTIAGLKSAQANFEQFALQTKNRDAKQVVHGLRQPDTNPYKLRTTACATA